MCIPHLQQEVIIADVATGNLCPRQHQHVGDASSEGPSPDKAGCGAKQGQGDRSGGNGVAHRRIGGGKNINLKVRIEYRLANARNLTLNCINFVGEYWAIIRSRS